jgi:sugar/nucleoside kinase (ribokinase family)
MSGPRGRIILKDKEPEIPKEGRLHGDYGLQNELLEFVSGTNFLIAQASKFPRTTLKIAQAVKRNGGKIILDYDASAKHDMKIVKSLLCLADYTLAAAEAKAPDRYEGDKGSLFERLVYSNGEYRAQLTSITDGTKPAMVNSRFQDWSMDIPLKDVPLVCNNGAGDTQKPAFAIGLLMNQTPELALHFACAMASFGVGYKDFTWLDHMQEFDRLYSPSL